MATFGIIHRFSEGTREQYDRTVKVVRPSGELPPGQTVHAAGASAEGWIVVTLWESREAWEHFRDEALVPGFAQVDNGLPAPPEETTFEIHSFRKGTQSFGPAPVVGDEGLNRFID